jgi:phenylacetate-CoA ligase
LVIKNGDEKMNEYVEKIKKELDSINRMSLDEFVSMQNDKFHAILLHHYNNPYNPAYRNLLKEHGIESEGDLPKTTDEINKLPLVDRIFLRQGNFDKVPCVAEAEIYKIIQTSGSTDNPLLFPYSYKSVKRLHGEFLVRSLIISNLDTDALHYWVTHYTSEKDNWSSHAAAIMAKEILGSNVIDESTQATIPQHINNILKYRPKIVGSSPNFFLAVANNVKNNGINFKDSSLKEVFAAGSAFLDEERRYLKNILNLEKVLQFYMTSECFTIGAEENESKGYCIYSDEHLAEIVDEENKQVTEGQKGKMLVTSLSMDSVPIIRFSLGDEIKFLGKSAINNKFMIISDIKRLGEASFGDGLMHYTEIELIPRYASSKGIPIMTIQLAKQKKEGKDLPVIRVETPIQDFTLVEKVIKEAFMQNSQMRNEIESGMICSPKVEIYGPGHLRKGKFKVPIFINET